MLQRMQHIAHLMYTGRVLLWLDADMVPIYRWFVQDCIISSADALEILQSCTKPSICQGYFMGTGGLYDYESVCIFYAWKDM